MTTAEIVRIPLDTSDFSKFAELWERFQTEAKKQPELWKKIAQAQQGSTTQFERMSAALLAQNELDRQRKEYDEQHLKNLQQSESLWHRISTHSTSLFSNVLGISGQFLKWGGLLAGTAVGVTTGSLFGFDRLAGGIAGERQESKGLGLSIGQESAFNILFKNYLGNPTGFLQNVLGIESNYSQLWKWSTLNNLTGGTMGPMTGNMSRDDIAFLIGERNLALEYKNNLPQLGLFARMLGLQTSDLLNLGNTPNAEFNKLVQSYPELAKKLNISDKSAAGATAVQRQFSTAWKMMETGLWNALTPLSGPIIHLSQAFTHAATVVLGSPAVRAGIKDFSDWISKFSTTVTSKEFDQKLKGFMANVGTVASGMATLAGAMHKFGLGNVASGYAGLKGGAFVGSLIGGPVGAAAGAAVGATAGDLGWEIYKHGPADYAAFYGALGAAYAPTARASGPSGNALTRADAAAAGAMGAAYLPPGNVNITISFLNTPGANPVVSFNGLAGH